MDKKRVGVVGASGYAGFELIKLLCKHSGIEIIAANSGTFAGKKISSLYPNFEDKEMAFTNYSTQQLLDLNLDLLFLATPNGIALNTVPKVIDCMKVVDLSADYRFSDASVFEKVYAIKQTDSANLPNAVYGLPELFREKIKSARVVANPGCYATSMILSGLPLVKNDLVDSIIFDSKSGYSGAGREKTDNAVYQEKIKDNLIAYNISKHRHVYEVRQFLPTSVSFTPHVMALFRGIMSTQHALLKEKISGEQVLTLFEEFYSKEKFVKASKELPDLHAVANTNLFSIGGFEVDENNQLVTIGVLDNLVKGAAGQAVQNMNLMLGFDEETALT